MSNFVTEYLKVIELKNLLLKWKKISEDYSGLDVVDIFWLLHLYSVNGTGLLQGKFISTDFYCSTTLPQSDSVVPIRLL